MNQIRPVLFVITGILFATVFLYACDAFILIEEVTIINTTTTTLPNSSTSTTSTSSSTSSTSSTTTTTVMTTTTTIPLPSSYSSISFSDIQNNLSSIVTSGDFVSETDVTSNPLEAGKVILFTTTEGNSGKMITRNTISGYEPLMITYEVYSAGGTLLKSADATINQTYIFDFETNTYPDYPYTNGDIQWNWQTTTHCTFRANNSAKFYVMP